MLNRQPIPWMAVLFGVLCLPCLSAQTVQVEGTVRDAGGAVIVNASVVLNVGSYHAATDTDPNGHFLFASISANSGTITISREGFSTATQSWNVGTAGNVNLDIVLQPASSGEQVTVSAARTEVRLSE